MQKNVRKYSITALFLAGIFFVLLIVLGAVFCSWKTPEPVPKNLVYVWQQHWSPAVIESVTTAGKIIDGFMVLGAEFVVEDGILRCLRPNIDWALLAGTRRPVELVVRAHVLPKIETINGRENAAEALENVVRKLCKNIDDNLFSGLQIDFDCPTEDLVHYSALLKLLHEKMPDVALSITTLPTWLHQKQDFRELVKDLDHYILQVHSFSRPRDIDDTVTLCNSSLVPVWVKEATAFGCPFYVALPTYGYRMHFDINGAFTGITAEGIDATYEEDSTREVLTDPVVMGKLVTALKTSSLRHCRGFVWFRLPVQGDRLNWSWQTLVSVMNGEAPHSDVRMELRKPQPGLYEIWLVNHGAHHPTKESCITLDWQNTGLQACDVVGGFKSEFKHEGLGCKLIGIAPHPGEEKAVAWFRFSAPLDKEEDVIVHAEVSP